jgi:hypothetical protein
MKILPFILTLLLWVDGLGSTVGYAFDFIGKEMGIRTWWLNARFRLIPQVGWPVIGGRCGHHLILMVVDSCDI